MDNEEKATQAEFELLHKERHRQRRLIESKDKTIQLQAEKIRELESVILDAIADLEAGLE